MLRLSDGEHGFIGSKAKVFFICIASSAFIMFMQTIKMYKERTHIYDMVGFSPTYNCPNGTECHHLNAAIAKREEQLPHRIKPNVNLTLSSFVPITNDTRTIRFLNGYSNIPWLTTSELAKTFISKSHDLCGGYRCHILTGEPIQNEDMSVFFGLGLPKKLPHRKLASQAWLFFSEEPQQFLPLKPSPAWNSQFNYSFTFLRQSEANQAGVVFSAPFRKRRERLHRNFAKEKLTLGRVKESANGTANALWFVSNCKPVGTSYGVGSNRLEYTKNLSRYVHVNAFSNYKKQPKCSQLLGNLLRKNEEKWNPQYNDYWFYLSFENNHCKDYITEKFWKILTQDLLVIPIVMGVSMKEYERVSPPNSFIHVDNFTSSEHLSKHLHYIASNADAFNYYLQWRNEYEFITPDIEEKYTRKLCYLCRLAHERPHRTWTNFTSEFTKSDCRRSR